MDNKGERFTDQSIFQKTNAVGVFLSRFAFVNVCCEIIFCRK
ncbi:MAG: hypothetical protein RR993_01835 [Clostridia bacterium]